MGAPSSSSMEVSAAGGAGDLSAAAAENGVSGADSAAEAEQNSILVMRQELETFNSTATSAERKKLQKVQYYYNIISDRCS